MNFGAFACRCEHLQAHNVMHCDLVDLLFSKDLCTFENLNRDILHEGAEIHKWQISQRFLILWWDCALKRVFLYRHIDTTQVKACEYFFPHLWLRAALQTMLETGTTLLSGKCL